MATASIIINGAIIAFFLIGLPVKVLIQDETQRKINAEGEREWKTSLEWQKQHPSSLSDTMLNPLDTKELKRRQEEIDDRNQKARP